MRTTSRSDVWITNADNTLSFPSVRSKNNLGVLIPLNCDIVELFLQMIPLGITLRLAPGHRSLPRSLHRPSGMHSFIHRLSLHGFHQKFPCFLAPFNSLLPMKTYRLVALLHPS